MCRGTPPPPFPSPFPSHAPLDALNTTANSVAPPLQVEENYLELKAAAAHFAKAYDEDGMSAAEQTGNSTEGEDEDEDEGEEARE